MFRRTAAPLLALLALSAATSGCMAMSTLTPKPPTAVPAAQPTGPDPATSTPDAPGVQPSAEPAGSAPPAQIGPRRIEFAPGAISAWVAGSVAGGGDEYVLGARAGQVMLVSFGPRPGGDLSVTVRGVDGVAVAGGALPRVAVELPSTQDYAIRVDGTPGTDYELNVTISGGSMRAPPARVRFEPGATSAEAAGSVAAGDVMQYIVRASAGQTLRLELLDSTGAYIPAVKGADGQYVLGWDEGIPAGFEQPTVLPSDQDYIVALLALGGTDPVQRTNFRLRMAIDGDVSGGPGDDPVDDPDDVAERVAFRPGATAVRLTGQLEVGSPDRYHLAAVEGQWLLSALTADDPSLFVSVKPVGGSALTPGTAGGTFARQWLGRLPGTQDYEIEVFSQVGAGGARYTLDVAVETLDLEPIVFEPGSAEGSATGTLEPLRMAGYVLGAAAGQTMSIGLAASGGAAAFALDGMGTEVGEGVSPVYTAGTPASLELPATRDYPVVVVSLAGTSEYTLEIAIE